MNLVQAIRAAGRIAEPTPTSSTSPTTSASAVRVVSEQPLPLSDSVQVRHVDAGSCNDCELELVAAFGPVYDAERYGARLVASPRHADVLTVSGPVTRNMVDALLRTYEAMSMPRRVVALGDGAIDGGAFLGGHGVAGVVADFLPVDIEVAGDPPTPSDIIDAIRRLTGR
jgi:Ni,Fe-hydrogenase III small subunit